MPRRSPKKIATFREIKGVIQEGQLPEYLRSAFDLSDDSGGNESGLSGHINNSSIHLDEEAVQDVVAALLTEGSNISITYDDASNTLTIASSQRTQEEIEDIVGGLLVEGANITLTYDDASNTLTIAASGAGDAIDEAAMNNWFF